MSGNVDQTALLPGQSTSPHSLSSIQMMNQTGQPSSSRSDLNNNEIVASTSTAKRKKTSNVPSNNDRPYTIGQIKEVRMLNFMCHKNFAIKFHPTPMQIVTGANGSGRIDHRSEHSFRQGHFLSGKSTIANAICLVLGAQARTTGRTSNAQSFIRKGEK